MTPRLLVAATALAGAASLFTAPHATAAPSPGGIAWQQASTDAEVDKAFATARQQGKPVFLYWGAVWCPPCNQVKATLFNRPDFIERSRAFVPVYVDGDKPGAQMVASRFKVSGYPTMILFKPDGTEVTRLPGEVDPQRYLLTLTAGLEAQMPVKELLARAAGGQPLTAQQWQLLAFYSWDTDEQQALPAAELPARLAALSAAVPADQSQVRDRLALKALAAAAKAKPAAGAQTMPADPALVAALERVLGDAAAVRAVPDVLAGYADAVVPYVAPAGDARRALATRYEAALSRLQADTTLSRGDRTDVLYARTGLWKVIDNVAEDPKAPAVLPDARRNVALKEVAALVAASTDKYERQAVVPSAGYVLQRAGLLAESDELLRLELPKAVAPYYHMLGLASNAKLRKDAGSALAWYEKAWKASEGPATKIQWGVNYTGNVIELAPTDVARVEAAASGVVAQLEPKGETFYERNQRALQRMATRLAVWQGSDPQRQQAVQRVRAQLAKTCTRLPAKDVGRAHCDQVFAAAAEEKKA